MKLNPAQQLIAEFSIVMENREAVVAVADGSRFPFAAALKGISLGDKRPKEDTYGAPHEYTGAYTWDYLPRHSRKIIPFRGEMDYGGYGGQPFTPLKYTVQAFTKAWIESAVRDENMLAAWNAAAEEHPMVKSLVTSLCNSSTPLKFGAPDPFTGRYNLEEDDDNCLKTNQ